MDRELVAEPRAAGPDLRSVALDVTQENRIPAQYGRIANLGTVTCGSNRGDVKQMTMSLAGNFTLNGITVNDLDQACFKSAQNAAIYENADWMDCLSDRIPVKRPDRIDDLTAPLLFLTSEGGRYVTGQTPLGDVGLSVGATRAMPRKAP